MQPARGAHGCSQGPGQGSNKADLPLKVATAEAPLKTHGTYSYKRTCVRNSTGRPTTSCNWALSVIHKAFGMKTGGICLKSRMFPRRLAGPGSHLSPAARLELSSYGGRPHPAGGPGPYLVVLRVRLEQAVLLDGHGRGQGHGVGPLLPFFLAAALHARGGGLGERAAAQALVPASLKRNQHSLVRLWVRPPAPVHRNEPHGVNGQTASWTAAQMAGGGTLFPTPTVPSHSFLRPNRPACQLGREKGR